MIKETSSEIKLYDIVRMPSSMCDFSIVTKIYKDKYYILGFLDGKITSKGWYFRKNFLTYKKRPKVKDVCFFNYIVQIIKKLNKISCDIYQLNTNTQKIIMISSNNILLFELNKRDFNTIISRNVYSEKLIIDTYYSITNKYYPILYKMYSS